MVGKKTFGKQMVEGANFEQGTEFWRRRRSFEKDPKLAFVDGGDRRLRSFVSVRSYGKKKRFNVFTNRPTNTL